MGMRVLVAGRNAKVLATAAGTFANDLAIETATSKAACFALLNRGEFDLIIACETLGDGSGLEVLSHVAVNTPNTLRIFAARPSTLKLLKGELGLFGLFRTLPYPINFRKLWASLSLARSCCIEAEPRQAPPPPQRQAPGQQQLAPARPTPPSRIPESDAFKRAQARRREPAMTNASLAELARMTTTRPATHDSHAPGGRRNRAAIVVGSGVFAAATAAVLTFFMLNANNSMGRGSLPLVASIARPTTAPTDWQTAAGQEPARATVVRNDSVAPAVPDVEVEVEAQSDASAIEPGHPGPPPPNPPPGPSEPPTVDYTGMPPAE